MSTIRTRPSDLKKAHYLVFKKVFSISGSGPGATHDAVEFFGAYSDKEAMFKSLEVLKIEHYIVFECSVLELTRTLALSCV